MKYSGICTTRKRPATMPKMPVYRRIVVSDTEVLPGLGSWTSTRARSGGLAPEVLLAGQTLVAHVQPDERPRRVGAQVQAHPAAAAGAGDLVDVAVPALAGQGGVAGVQDDLRTGGVRAQVPALA